MNRKKIALLGGAGFLLLTFLILVLVTVPEPPPPDPSATSAESPLAPAKPDPKRPLSSYPQVETTEQVAALYFALTGEEPDFGRIASMDYEHRKIGDAFAKQADVERRTTVYKKEMEAYKDRYFYMRIAGAKLQSYDIKTRSFPIEVYMGTWLRDGGYSWYDRGVAIRIEHSNRHAFLSYKVSDQATAREIEAKKGSARGSYAQVYLFAKAVNTKKYTIYAQVVQADLYDGENRLIAQLKPE